MPFGQINMLEQFVNYYESKQRFVVFDVETVGNFNNPIIVEIGGIEAGIEFSENPKTFQKILQFTPDSWHPFWRQLKIHNIPTEQIENGENREKVLKDFLHFTENSILICHTNFDINAIKINVKKIPSLKYAEKLTLWDNFIDSCALAKEICPHLSSFSLKNLSNYFQIKNPNAHRALSDALTTKKIIAKLLKVYYSQKLKYLKIKK